MAFARRIQNPEGLYFITFGNRNNMRLQGFVNLANLVRTVANGHLCSVRSVQKNTPHNEGH